MKAQYTVRAKQGQNIFDVCIQEFGDNEQLFILLDDNDLTLNSKLIDGQELIINNENLGNENIKNFVSLNNIKYNNGQTEEVPPTIGGAYSVAYSSAYN